MGRVATSPRARAAVNAIRAAIDIAAAVIGIVIEIETVTADAMVRDVRRRAAIARVIRIAIRAASDPDGTAQGATTVRGVRRVPGRVSDRPQRPARRAHGESLPLGPKARRRVATRHRHREPINPVKAANRGRQASAAVAAVAVAVADAMAATPRPTATVNRAAIPMMEQPKAM